MESLLQGRRRGEIARILADPRLPQLVETGRTLISISNQISPRSANPRNDRIFCSTVEKVVTRYLRSEGNVARRAWSGRETVRDLLDELNRAAQIRELRQNQ